MFDYLTSFYFSLLQKFIFFYFFINVIVILIVSVICVYMCQFILLLLQIQSKLTTNQSVFFSICNKRSTICITLSFFCVIILTNAQTSKTQECFFIVAHIYIHVLVTIKQNFIFLHSLCSIFWVFTIVNNAMSIFVDKCLCIAMLLSSG